MYASGLELIRILKKKIECLMIFVVILLSTQLYSFRIEIISPDVIVWCYFPAAVSDSGPIQAVKEVKVVDIGVKSFTLSWRKTPGASGYKISWIPFLGKGPHIQWTMCAYTLILTYMHVCTDVDTRMCLYLCTLMCCKVLLSSGFV